MKLDSNIFSGEFILISSHLDSMRESCIKFDYHKGPSSYSIARKIELSLDSIQKVLDRVSVYESNIEELTTLRYNFIKILASIPYNIDHSIFIDDSNIDDCSLITRQC